VKLGNCAVIGQDSRLFQHGLHPSKASTVRELQRGLPRGLGALRTIRSMLLSTHVLMRGRRAGQSSMVMIGGFLANHRTVCFAHGSHCCVGAEQCHCKNNRRWSTMQHNFYDTTGGIFTQLNRFKRFNFESRVIAHGLGMQLLE
jgi:hypothetical protein